MIFVYMYCTLSNKCIRCTVCSVNCTLHYVHFTLYIVCALHTVNCVYIACCTMFTVHCTLHYIHCTMYTLLYTLYIVHCTNVPCTCVLPVCKMPDPVHLIPMIPGVQIDWNTPGPDTSSLDILSRRRSQTYAERQLRDRH